MSVDNKQIGGSHYKTSGMQHWTMCAMLNIGYLEGNCVKYLCRWRSKGGIIDLEKASHYLEKLIEMVLSGDIERNNAVVDDSILEEYFRDTKMPYPESLIASTVLTWRHVGNLRAAHALLCNFINDVKAEVKYQ